MEPNTKSSSKLSFLYTKEPEMWSKNKLLGSEFTLWPELPSLITQYVVEISLLWKMKNKENMMQNLNEELHVEIAFLSGINELNEQISHCRSRNENYTGWPRKNGMGYFPQYVDAITGIGIWGNFSWEKWYQDQQFWFSSLFSTAHYVRRCRGPKLPLFSLN